jgi:hypothetical protein
MGDSVLLPATLLDLRKQNTLVTTYLPTSSTPKNSTNSTFTSQSQKNKIAVKITLADAENKPPDSPKRTPKNKQRKTHTHTHTHKQPQQKTTPLKLVCTKPPVDTLQRKFSSELYLKHLFYLLLLLLLLVPALQ